MRHDRDEQRAMTGGAPCQRGRRCSAAGAARCMYLCATLEPTPRLTLGFGAVVWQLRRPRRESWREYSLSYGRWGSQRGPARAPFVLLNSNTHAPECAPLASAPPPEPDWAGVRVFGRVRCFFATALRASYVGFLMSYTKPYSNSYTAADVP